MDSISILSMHFYVCVVYFIQFRIVSREKRRGNDVPYVAFLFDDEIERGMRFVFTSASSFL